VITAMLAMKRIHDITFLPALIGLPGHPHIPLGQRRGPARQQSQPANPERADRSG
jgi:hypothetical protein